ncbi:MAG: response regulator transcription factor [Candidatus Brocadiaceae bacterium]|nr:response regulator transcription factor [Candidatus Brocadiaceae bacterium]
MTEHSPIIVQWGDTVGTIEDDPRLRVLLVDDHAMVRYGLTQLFAAEADIRVVGQAADGAEGVELTRRLKPDVVLMDVAMPGMNGIEAADRIKKEMPHVRVVALSMHNMDDVRRRMLAAGADEYVRKTSSPERLLAAVRGPERR